MKKTVQQLLSIAATIATLALGFNLVSVSAFADDNEVCTAASLHGSYGEETIGSIVAFGPIGPVAEVGVVTFDGQGTASGTSTVSLNGTITARSSVSGSYQVNPDCTGDLVLVLPVAPGVTINSTSHFVIVDNGKEIRSVNTGAGRVLLTNAKRQ